MGSAEPTRGSFGHGTTSLLGTRIHAQSGERPSLSNLEAWCVAALRSCDYVVIVADGEMHAEVEACVRHLGPRLRVVLVSPWHGFTPALNAIVAEARLRDVDKVVLMSREVHPDRAQLDLLMPWIAPNVLVVGPCLTPAHGARRGIQPIDAFNCPWNTLAVWNAHLLGLTGFPSICDGHRRDVPAGMEEVITISLFQQIYQGRAKAFLVELPGVEWLPPVGDTERGEAHRTKMATKEQRAAAQLERMGIAPGTVAVVSLSKAMLVVAPTAPPPPNAPEALEPDDGRR